MKYLRPVCLFLFFVFDIQAQLGKEAWHWQFGENCGLDFSSGTPIPDTSSVFTLEGTASISDPNTGALLFYTDGVTVWNKNNIQMANGDSLFGNSTTTQSALIIPKPGSKNLFYVFTCDFEGKPHGVCYSVVDMNLNGGLGDVILKNQLLTPAPTAEKITAVRHCNGFDFWIIDHPLSSNSFNVYLLDASGLNLTPIVSNVGVTLTNVGQYGAGYLKASPNGKKLAAGYEYPSVVEIYDFNTSTGVVSNPITITCSPGYGVYGLSFSPDDSKLYTSTTYDKHLYQYDLSSNLSSTIVASQIVIDSLRVYGGLQLGPDGKIYVAKSGSQNLDVISSPNLAGLACNLQHNVIAFQNSKICRWGLPNFIDGGIAQRKNVRDTSVCSSSLPMALAPIDSVYSQPLWSTGDTIGSISANNFGNYWVSYLNLSGCRVSDTFHIRPTIIPTVNILKDTTACSNQLPISINAVYPGSVSYHWSDGYTQNTHLLSTSGVYWVDYTFMNGCVSRDSFYFSINNAPVISLGSDTSLCQPYVLSANSAGQYNWSTGSTNPQITVTSSGHYAVTVTSPQGCKNSDTVDVTIYTPPKINVLHDSTECGNTFNPVSLDALYPNTVNYTWSDGLSGQFHTINTPGMYWVQYTLNNTCVSVDTFSFFIYPYPTVDLGNDTTFCLGRKILNAYNPNCMYRWSNGETTSQITATRAGTYWVEVNNHGCINVDTTVVEPDVTKLNFLIPNIVTPNGDNINDEIDFSTYQFSAFHISIFNRWGVKIFESADPNCIWQPADEDGTYYYTTDCHIDCGLTSKQASLQGYLTILR